MKSDKIIFILIGVLTILATFAAPFAYDYYKSQNIDPELRILIPVELKNPLYIQSLEKDFVYKKDGIRNVHIYEKFNEEIENLEKNLIYEFGGELLIEEKNVLLRGFLLNSFGQIIAEYPKAINEDLYNNFEGDTLFEKKQKFEIPLDKILDETISDESYFFKIFLIDSLDKKIIYSSTNNFKIKNISGFDKYSPWIMILLMVFAIGGIMYSEYKIKRRKNNEMILDFDRLRKELMYINLSKKRKKKR